VNNQDFADYKYKLHHLTERQKREIYRILEAEHFDTEDGGWWETDSPTTEFRAMTSFAA
jgi:hypothetical protein